MSKWKNNQEELVIVKTQKKELDMNGILWSHSELGREVVKVPQEEVFNKFWND